MLSTVASRCDGRYGASWLAIARALGFGAAALLLDGCAVLRGPRGLEDPLPPREAELEGPERVTVRQEEQEQEQEKEPVEASEEAAPRGLGPPWNDEVEGERTFGAEIPKLEVREDFSRVRFGLYSATDFIWYDENNSRSDEVRFTDLRPTVAARAGEWSARLEGDLVGVDTRNHLYEAWGAWEPDPMFRLTVGQMRLALGSEGATHESDLPFIGYGFVPQLTNRYDIGVRGDGNLVDGLWYAAWGTIGHGFGLEGQELSSPQFGLRGVVHPFRLVGLEAESGFGFLRGLHVGGSVAHMLDGDDPAIAASPFQTLLLTTPDLGGDSGGWEHLEVGFTVGPVQISGERGIGGVDNVAIPGGETDVDQLSGETWALVWNLSGEPRTWRNGAWANGAGEERSGPFSWLPDGIWTFAARHSNGDFDRSLFTYGFTTYTLSTQEVRTNSFALFWEPSSRLRFGMQYTKIIADDFLTTLGGTNRDDTFALRLELRF